jgi:hypothetical protein
LKSDQWDAAGSSVCQIGRNFAIWENAVSNVRSTSTTFVMFLSELTISLEEEYIILYIKFSQVGLNIRCIFGTFWSLFRKISDRTGWKLRD